MFVAGEMTRSWNRIRYLDSFDGDSLAVGPNRADSGPGVAWQIGWPVSRRQRRAGNACRKRKSGNGVNWERQSIWQIHAADGHERGRERFAYFAICRRRAIAVKCRDCCCCCGCV